MHWRFPSRGAGHPAPLPFGPISEFQKLFLTPDPNHLYIPAILFHSEGRFANVTDAGRGAVDAAARLTGDANVDGEDVWS
jgi:hypothetical protein